MDGKVIGMCSTNELKTLINANSRQIENIHDTVTRVAHYSEKTSGDLETHTQEEETRFKRIEDKIDDLSQQHSEMKDQNQEVIEYINRIQVLGWFGGKIKALLLFIIALGGAWVIGEELVEYLRKFK